MNRFLLAFVAPAALAATLSISPDPVFECSGGVGVATLTWSGASGPVELRVGSATGPSMTGITGASGTAETGNWVSDGLRFFLVSQLGNVEASLTARVRCGGTASGVDLALKSGSFFPLQVGNRWVYRYNSRAVTASYITTTVTGTRDLGGQTYYVLTSDDSATQTLRGDNEGRIYRFTGTPVAPKEELLLDPANLTHAPFAGDLGTFPDAVFRSTIMNIGRDEVTYVRGLGPVKLESFLMTGSSGGFVQGAYLIDATLEGIRLNLPAPTLSVSIESPELDLTNKKATNCAVVSYCVGCFGELGVYKPCAQARVAANAASPYTLELELVDAANQVVFRAPQISGGPSEVLRYVQLQLYSPGPKLLTPGSYTLVTRLKSGNDVLATSTLAMSIR